MSTTGGTKGYPQEIQEVVDRGYYPRKPYPGSPWRPWRVACIQCGKDRSIRLDFLRQGGYPRVCCGETSRRREPREAVHDLPERVDRAAAQRAADLHAAGFEAVGPDPRHAAAQELVRCRRCGKQQLVSRRAVRAGARCRACA